MPPRGQQSHESELGSRARNRGAALGNKRDEDDLSAAFEGVWGKLVPPQSPRWGDNRGVNEKEPLYDEESQTGDIEILR
jgi:hypothetical protein